MNGNGKVKTYISYGEDEHKMSCGSFDEIPENANVAIIHLSLPSFDGKSKEEFVHRKFCGRKLTAEVFLGVYSHQVPISILMKIKEEIMRGKNIMFIPFGKDFTHYTWITEKDAVYETKKEFEEAIRDFKEKYESIIFILESEDFSKKIK